MPDRECLSGRQYERLLVINTRIKRTFAVLFMQAACKDVNSKEITSLQFLWTNVSVILLFKRKEAILESINN